MSFAESWLETVNCSLPSIPRPDFLLRTLLCLAMASHWRYHVANVTAAEIWWVSRVWLKRCCAFARGLMNSSSQILSMRLLVDCFRNYCVSCSALMGLLLTVEFLYWNGCPGVHGHRQDVLTPIWTACSGSSRKTGHRREGGGHGQQHGSYAASARTLCAT